MFHINLREKLGNLGATVLEANLVGGLQAFGDLGFKGLRSFDSGPLLLDRVDHLLTKVEPLLELGNSLMEGPGHYLFLHILTL